MDIRNLPRDPGITGWNAILPEEPARAALEGSRRIDWLVIGAGFAGLAAARQLTKRQPDASIAIVDATRVGHGPAGRNSGFMIDLPHDLQSEDYGGSVETDRRRTAMNRAAIDFAADAAKEYGLSEEAFARPGKINAAATDAGLRHNAAYERHLSNLGEACEMLDAAAMQALTGSDYYRGGLYTPGAALIQPAMFVRGLARGLEAAGVKIHENSPVVGLDRDNGVWTARTPGGTVSAPGAILAVNGHAESFGFFRRRLVHVFTYASMTRTLTPGEVDRLGGKPAWACTPADPMGTTVRKIAGTGGHRIVVRNRVTYNPSMRVSDATLKAVCRDHDKAFRARFPKLADTAMEFRWGGRLCLSLNDSPAFGEVAEGLFSACCQNGLGTVKGTLAGMLAADLATGETSALLDQILSEDRPKRLPPEPIAWIGATARIRMGEAKAGREL